ncbi:ANK [Mytilus coruscus]|uniref:ANK n=1 Tax=Mytilus coruscus TaxID=42192 RepID=A0A6J8CNP2_MYTCO|nr:ANK [Mytilus coruscus]
MSFELFMECERLNFTGLDLLNIDIKLRIKNAFKELSEFKTLHEELTKEWEIQQEKKTNPIPPNLRVKIEKQLKGWREDDNNYFVSTKGSKAVFESIKEQPCVAVTGSFGMGKTAIIKNVALLMRSNGYIVVPVTDPLEIKKYKHPIEKNLFVVKNFCGKCDLEEEELEAWNNCGVEFDENCKLLVTCKLQVYRAIRHETLNNITFHECNLISNDICLSLNERQSIARKYDINILDIVDSIEFYNCFPLLCKYFTDSNINDAKTFFKHPFEVFETQFEMLQTLGANGKVCALMALLMFYDHIPKTMITGDTKWNVKYIIANTSKICKLGTEDSCITIHKELENLIDTYVVKKEGVYHALNERIFNLLLDYFGNQMTGPLISYSCTSFIRERFQLSDPIKNKEDYNMFRYVGSDQKGIKVYSSTTWDKVGPNAVILTDVEYRKLYVDRMLKDLSNGYVNDVFQNPNRFHVFFFEYLNHRDGIELLQLLKKTDITDGSTPMIAHCRGTTYVHSSDEKLNDIFLRWLIDNGCPINVGNVQGETAIFHAAVSNNSRMIETLINHKGDTNICTTEGYSPLHVACLYGYSQIANILLISGANCHTITTKGNTPLHAACCNGHTFIVTELLQRGADLSISNNNGHTPLDLARLNEHYDIFQNIMIYSNTK